MVKDYELVKALDILTFFGSALAIVALPFFAVNWCLFTYRNRRGDRSIIGAWRNGTLPTKSMLFFLMPLLVAILATTVSESIAHDTVLQTLRSLSPNCTVSINGTDVQTPADTLQALKQLQWLPAHHSRPTNKIEVNVRDGQHHVMLWLGRDSDNPREYWVTVPRYWVTPSMRLAGKDIGRIISPVFDSYD